jgi:hypothetical protein
MPVILASPETEIRRITVQGQPRQEKRDLISKYPTQKRVGGVSHGEGSEFKPQYHKKKKSDILCYTYINCKHRIFSIVFR